MGSGYSDSEQEYLCRKNELKDVVRKTRKTMTMYGALCLKSDVNRLYIKRKERGKEERRGK